MQYIRIYGYEFSGNGMRLTVLTIKCSQNDAWSCKIHSVSETTSRHKIERRLLSKAHMLKDRLKSPIHLI